MVTRRKSAIVGTVVLVLYSVLSCPSAVRAQESLEASDFNIDLFTGPILGSNRIIAMGGAFTALASGIDAVNWNPAAYAMRSLWTRDWFEWDATVGLLIPGAFSANDFFNNGAKSGIGVDDFIFFDTGLKLQFANLGAGGMYSLRNYSIPLTDQTADVNHYTAQFGAAWAFFGGDLTVGLALIASGMQITIPTAEEALVAFDGIGGEVGAVFRPAALPLRIGLAVRTPVYAKQAVPEDETGEGEPLDQVAGFVLPMEVRLPWEARLGMAWQFGRRPLNQRWYAPEDPTHRLVRALKRKWCERERRQALQENKDQPDPAAAVGQCPRLRRRVRDRSWRRAEAERRDGEEDQLEDEIDRQREGIRKNARRHYEALPRYYWLVSIEGVIIGDVPAGIGLDAFLDQERRISGNTISGALHLGSEVEPWPNRLKIRLGGYVEPSRQRGVNPRVHGTAGLDFRLFTWDLFGWVDPFSIRAGGMVDVAARYFNWGVGLGMWH